MIQRQIARLTQWVLRWADPSLLAAPLQHALTIANAYQIRAASDLAVARTQVSIANSARAQERLGRITAETTLATMRVADADRIEREQIARAEQEALDLLVLQQAQQRASDLESYRAYLYDLMPDVCQRAGLDPSLIRPAWTLSATGKLNDVLHHLGALDQRGHPIATLGDVIDLFVGRA